MKPEKNTVKYFSTYSQENIMVNGTIVLIVIPILRIMQFSPALTVMSTTAQKWMISIPMRLITNIPVWLVWIATL